MRSRLRRLSTRGWIITAVVVVILVGGGLGAWFATRPSPVAAATSQIETVGTGTIIQSVASTGTIEPASQANLSFAVAGRVTAVDVAAGQVVTAGQTLATLDPTALAAAVAQAQATLSSDQAKLATDQADGASSAQLAADEATVAAAQSSVTAAQTSLADATLTSTIAGTVASVDLSVGQQVSAGSAGGSGSGAGGTGSGGASSTGSAGGAGGLTGAAGGSATSAASSSSSTTAQFVIISTGSYIVSATVGDTQVSEITVGDQAVITPSGATTNVYGTVASIGLVATESSGVATFPVVVDVTGSPPGLYAGTSANLAITVKELQGVMVVPTTALHYTTSETTVDVVRDGSTVATPVTVGTSSAGQTQVTSGLAVGDQIVVPVISFRGFGGGGGGAGGRFGGAAGRIGGAGPGGGGFGGAGAGGGGFGGGGFGG